MNKNAMHLASLFARDNGLEIGGFYQFETLDKTVFAVTFGRKTEDGSTLWFEPRRSDGRIAFVQMPRLIIDKDGTVFRYLLSLPPF